LQERTCHANDLAVRVALRFHQRVAVPHRRANIRMTEKLLLHSDRRTGPEPGIKIATQVREIYIEDRGQCRSSLAPRASFYLGIRNAPGEVRVGVASPDKRLTSQCRWIGMPV